MPIICFVQGSNGINHGLLLEPEYAFNPTLKVKRINLMQGVGVQLGPVLARWCTIAAEYQQDDFLQIIGGYKYRSPQAPKIVLPSLRWPPRVDVSDDTVPLVGLLLPILRIYIPL